MTRNLGRRLFGKENKIATNWDPKHVSTQVLVRSLAGVSVDNETAQLLARADELLSMSNQASEPAEGEEKTTESVNPEDDSSEKLSSPEAVDEETAEQLTRADELLAMSNQQDDGGQMANEGLDIVVTSSDNPTVPEPTGNDTPQAQTSAPTDVTWSNPSPGTSDSMLAQQETQDVYGPKPQPKKRWFVMPQADHSDEEESLKCDVSESSSVISHQDVRFQFGRKKEFNTVFFRKEQKQTNNEAIEVATIVEYETDGSSPSFETPAEVAPDASAAHREILLPEDQPTPTPTRKVFSRWFLSPEADDDQDSAESDEAQMEDEDGEGKEVSDVSSLVVGPPNNEEFTTDQVHGRGEEKMLQPQEEPERDEEEKHSGLRGREEEYIPLSDQKEESLIQKDEEPEKRLLCLYYLSSGQETLTTSDSIDHNLDWNKTVTRVHVGEAEDHFVEVVQGLVRQQSTAEDEKWAKKSQSFKFVGAEGEKMLRRLKKTNGGRPN